MLSRRQLFRYGLGGTALLAAGGVGLALQGTVMREPREPLRVLDATEFSVLAAVADRIAPGDGEAFPSAWEARVPERIDELLETIHPADVAELKQLLRLLESALFGFVLDGRPRTFTASSAEQQDAVLRDWQGSRIGVRRTGARALQKTVLAAYYGAPETWEAVGYPGPPDFGNTAATP